MKLFFAIAFPPGTFYVGSCGIALNSTTRRHPRLGLVAGSRGPTQIHIRGLRHSRPVSRRATSAPSHRGADEPPGPQAPGKQARLVHTDRTDRSRRGARLCRSRRTSSDRRTTGVSPHHTMACGDVGGRVTDGADSPVAVRSASLRSDVTSAFWRNGASDHWGSCHATLSPSRGIGCHGTLIRSAVARPHTRARAPSSSTISAPSLSTR